MNETIFNLAGIISSAMFMLSQLPMLYKAYKTNDMKSYSLTNLTMSLLGDLLYWVYLMDLPFGPVWMLHCFDTGCSILMLTFYLRQSFGPKVKHILVPKFNKH
jgi:hypothetical protein